MLLTKKETEKETWSNVRITPFGGIMEKWSDGVQESRVKLHILKATFVGANPNPQITAKELTQTISNYFNGNDPTKWRSGDSVKLLKVYIWTKIHYKFLLM
jgi:hypothetical protein